MEEKFNTIQNIQPNEISFSVDNGDTVGRLYKKDNLIWFDGDLDQSAQILFKYVCDIFNKE